MGEEDREGERARVSESERMTRETRESREKGRGTRGHSLGASFKWIERESVEKRESADELEWRHKRGRGTQGAMHRLPGSHIHT